MKSAKGTKAVLFLAVLLALSFSQSGFAAVKIGLLIPETGPFVQEGAAQLDGYKMAIDEINRNGGLLGEPIAFTTVNTESKPPTAVAAAKQLVGQGAVMLAGCNSSASAMAVSAEAQSSGVVYMAGLTIANETTGAQAHRHTFRWYGSAHQYCKALSTVLIQRFGKNARYAYIYADYAAGKSITETMIKFLEAGGASTVYTAATALGTGAGTAATGMKQRLGFLLELEKAAKSNPDVLVFGQFGSDLVAILKQAKTLRLQEKMALVAPVGTLAAAMEVGGDAIDGVITAATWYHGASERYEGSRKFVQDYENNYGRKPVNAAAAAYVNIMVWADAVKRTGTTDSEKIIRAIEDHRFTLLTKEEYFRKWDHQGIRSIYVLQGKRPSSTGSYDYFSIVGEVDGEQASRTRSENPVVLEALPGDPPDYFQEKQPDAAMPQPPQ